MAHEETPAKEGRCVALGPSLVVLFSLAAACVAAIRIHKIRYDPPGADYRTKRQLRAEYIVVKNTGKGQASRGLGYQGHSRTQVHVPQVSDRPWRLRQDPHREGRNVKGDLYWGSGNFVWNNDGDKASLRKQSGRTVDTCGYRGGASPNPPKYC